MLIYFAASLVMLMGFAGLVLDVGRMELRKTQLQTAADAGALSAAADLQFGSSSWKNGATAEPAALATLNGYPMPTVAVQQGVSSGPYLNDNTTVQVTLTQSVPTTFLKLLGIANTTLNAQAVAMIPPCIFFVGSSSSSPTFASASMNNLSGNCPVYSQNGFIVDGFAHICCSTPKTPAPSSASGGGGWTYPLIQSNSTTFTDPLAYLASPSFSACTPGLTGKNYTVDTPIVPGTYCGTLKVTGPNSGPRVNITMQPGLYIVTGGVALNNANITGNGVTIYLTHGGGFGFGTFYANASTVSLNAPMDNSSNGVPGITIFADRAWVGGTQDIQFNNASLYGDGIIYSIKTGTYSWATNMGGPHYFSLVTASLYYFGATLSPSANYSTLPGGNPLHLAVTLVQ